LTGSKAFFGQWDLGLWFTKANLGPKISLPKPLLHRGTLPHRWDCNPPEASVAPRLSFEPAISR
jgi:hypothetical protein